MKHNDNLHNQIKNLYRTLFAGVIILLNGCSLFQNDTESQAWLKPGVQAQLPAPGLNAGLKRQQYLTATVNGKSETLVTMLDIENDRLTLAGLSPLGIRLFKVTYSPVGIETEQSITLPQLPPVNQVLADIMLSYWPVNDWQPLLPQGWTLKDEQNKRLLRDEGHQVITEINYQTQSGRREPISIAQYAFNYHILILNMDD